MKINLIGMILNNCGERAFDGALVDDHGTELKAANSLHAMILEYARVWNGQESSFVALHHSNANPPVGPCTTCGGASNGRDRDQLIQAERLRLFKAFDKVRASAEGHIQRADDCGVLARDLLAALDAWTCGGEQS